MTATVPTWRCAHCGFAENRVYAAALEPTPHCTKCGKAQAAGGAGGDPRSTRAQAKALIDQKNFAGAIPLLDQALRSAPEDAELLYHVGWSRYETDDYPGANDHLSRLLRLQPDHPDGRRVRGYAR